MTRHTSAAHAVSRRIAALALVVALCTPALLPAAQRGPERERESAPVLDDAGAAERHPAAAQSDPVPSVLPGASLPDASPAPARGKQPSAILPGRPDVDPAAGADLLGDVFESKGNGIALRAPKGAVAVKRLGSKDIAEFVNQDTGWTLKLSKIMLSEPGSLVKFPDAQGRMQPGLLEFTAKRLKEEIPDAELLREERIQVAAGDVGLIVLRHTRAVKPMLSQQAILQKTDQLYYMIALTTPGAPKGTKDGSPTEQLAVATFSQMLDSIKLLDLAAVRADQDLRLFSARHLLLRFSNPKTIRSALIDEQWVRVIRNGKDIGYTYTQELDKEKDGRELMKGGQPGVEVRTRARLLPGADVQVDSGSILFVSMDLRHEDWSTLATFANLKQRAANKDYKPSHLNELGISDRRTIPGRGDDYTLTVQFESTKERVEPITRPLPPFYLPQAISHLLPRLVPLNEPKTFLFMVYAPDAREVMMRYIDVKEQRRVEFNKESYRAIAVEDRLGLEGSITTHYMSPEGKWIGSETKDTGVMHLPTDEKTLLALWKDANLTTPDAPEAEGADGAAEDKAPRSEDAAAADRTPGAARQGNKSATGAQGTDDASGAAPRTAPKVGAPRRPPVERKQR